MKSAMEQLWDYIDANYNEENFNIFDAKEKSLELEKQQIIDAFDEGQEYEYQYHINNTPKFDSQTYYAETYGSDVTSDFDKPFMDFAKQYVEQLKTKNK